MTLTMIVEWTGGSLERHDWKNGVLIPRDPPWPAEWGLPPVNYGCIPGYLNPADGAELDAIWADPAPVAVGTRLEGTVLGMIWVNDLDHKMILGDSLERLPLEALNEWFTGREPRMTGRAEALDFIASLPRID